MTTSQQTKIHNSGYKSNRRWLAAALVAGLSPFSLYYFQDFIPSVSYFESNEQLAALTGVLIIALIFSVPLLICSFAVLRLYKWWKLAPILMLLFNAVLMLFYVALANWNTATW